MYPFRRFLLTMRKLFYCLSAILLMALLLTSCTNGPKTLLHTLNLKIPGITERFKLAPFATQTAEASIVSVLPGFKFITEEGTAMRLTFATNVTVGYSDIKDILEVDLEELKDEASISSISTDVTIRFSEKIGDFNMPTIRSSFQMPDIKMEATSVKKSFEKPDLKPAIDSNSLNIPKVYIATNTTSEVTVLDAAQEVKIKEGLLIVKATNTTDASFTILIELENEHGEFTEKNGENPFTFQGTTSGQEFNINLTPNSTLTEKATITIIATALNLPLSGGELDFSIAMSATAINDTPISKDPIFNENFVFDKIENREFKQGFEISELKEGSGKLRINPATLTLDIKPDNTLEGLDLDLQILINNKSYPELTVSLSNNETKKIDISNTILTRHSTLTVRTTPTLSEENTREFFQGKINFTPDLDFELAFATDVRLTTQISSEASKTIKTGLADSTDFTFDTVTLNGDIRLQKHIPALDSQYYNATLTVSEKDGPTIVSTALTNDDQSISLDDKKLHATDITVDFAFETIDDYITVDFTYDKDYDASTTFTPTIGISKIASLTLSQDKAQQGLTFPDIIESATVSEGTIQLKIDAGHDAVFQRLFRGVGMDTFKATLSTTEKNFPLTFKTNNDLLEADLQGLELSGKQATLTLGTLTVNFTDEDAENLPNQIDISASVTNLKFSELMINVEDFYNDLVIEESEEFEIPEEARDYLKAIILSGDPKIKVEWNNNTPLELNFHVTVSNDILNEKRTLGKTQGASQTVIEVPNNINIEGLEKLQFNFQASPTGLDSNNKTLSLSDFAVDELENYSVSATVTFKDFSEGIDKRGDSITVEKVVLFGEIREELFELLLEHLPDFWKDYSGQIEIDEALTVAWVELDENVSNDNPDLSASLTVTAKDSGQTITEIPISLTDRTNFSANINEFLSKPSTDLSFEIAANVNEATVSLDNITVDATDLFSASVTVNIPVRFKVTQAINLLNETLNLGETLNIKLDDMDAILKLIESATAVVNARNNSGVSVELQLKWDGPNGVPIIKNKQGGDTVVLNNTEAVEFVVGIGEGSKAKDLLEKDVYAHVTLPDSQGNYYTVEGDSAVEFSIYLDIIVKVEIPLS